MESKELLDLVRSIDSRLKLLEEKAETAEQSTSRPRPNVNKNGAVPEQDLDLDIGVDSVDPDLRLGIGPDNNESSRGPTNQQASASRRNIETQRQFDSIKESLSRVSLPTQLKLNESTAGIKQEQKPTLKVITKSARFAETALRHLAHLTSTKQDDSSCFVLNEEDMSIFYTIFSAQQQFLQSEYAALVVKNTFDEETSKLFRSFENHTSAFTESSLNNLRIAADLAVSRERTLATRNRSRANWRARQRGFGSRLYRFQRGRGFSADWMTGRQPPTASHDEY